MNKREMDGWGPHDDLPDADADKSLLFIGVVCALLVTAYTAAAFGAGYVTGMNRTCPPPPPLVVGSFSP